VVKMRAAEAAGKLGGVDDAGVQNALAALEAGAYALPLLSSS
jgi:hypothetical protein